MWVTALTIKQLRYQLDWEDPISFLGPEQLLYWVACTNVPGGINFGANTLI